MTANGFRSINRIEELEEEANCNITALSYIQITILSSLGGMVGNTLKTTLANSSSKRDQYPSIALSYLLIFAGWDMIEHSGVSDFVSKSTFHANNFFVG
jgi:predicted transporter